VFHGHQGVVGLLREPQHKLKYDLSSPILALSEVRG
jgi:hypothetical protein